MKLWWDLETFSTKPIADGAHAYAEEAEVLLFAWALDDGPVNCWDCLYENIPSGLLNAISSADEYWGHNSAMFDRVVLKHCMFSLFSEMPEEKHRDTMVQALCHGLPGSLGTLCEVFRLGQDEAKDKRGKRLIQLFCKPNKKETKRYSRETHPIEWQEFIEYAKSDIVSMRIIHDKMPKWNYPHNRTELELWQIDQKINNLGVYVDVELAKAAIDATDKAKSDLSTEITKSTNGDVTSATQRDKLIDHIFKSYGITIKDMTSSNIESLLNDPNLCEGVKELLANRLIASMSSVNKYKKLIKSTSSDCYLRGTTQFCGASRTGRDAGRLFQPQNLMRPTLKNSEIEIGIEAIKIGCADLITENVMELCANVMRGVIIAPKKHKIVVADLSNIEGRVLAWLAGEEWKVQAFRDFDRGVGPDLYVASYAKTFNVSLEKANRQVGKVLELAMGFGGGVGAFLTFSSAYRLDLEKMTSGLSLPNDVVKEAEDFLAWRKERNESTYGLPGEVFIACDSLKRLWRRAHPKIVSFWKDSEDAFKIAVGGGHAKFGRKALAVYAHKCEINKKGNWVRILLPSGRYLSYPAPRSGDRVSFMGTDQFTRKWKRITTYGGKLVENQTQATARDVFKNCYANVMRSGYRIAMSVHDELVAYARDDAAHNAEHLSSLMSESPAWASDLPLAASGFEAYRYKKC
jgi:DNA polymerase